MDNRTRINKYFEESINKTFPKEVHRAFFLNHPYRNKFVNNMTDELIKIEYAKIRMFDVHQFKLLVHDMTKLFCKCAMESFNQKNLTKLQQTFKQKEFEAQNEIDTNIDKEIANIVELKRNEVNINTKSK